MMTDRNALQPIPLVDARNGGPLRHATASILRARTLRDDCLAFFPRAARPFLPLLDGLTRRWLTRSQSPYVGEIAAIASLLGCSGIWLLNGAYQWGCTALAREEEGLPWLARTLDWPFTGLGRHVEVAWKAGPAGDFYSATWPGYVGALSAMAPGRFAACVNQAPLFRRTRHPWLRPYDLAANALRTWGIRHIPPDQLLRQVFETCENFAAARRVLETVPVARPVIYTLIGCAAGERCVIERTEEGYTTRDDETTAANDWLCGTPHWEGRIGADLILTCSYEEAGDNSRARRETLANFTGSLARDCFAWIREPVLNRYTRMAVEMCPARAILRVVGYDVVAGCNLPQRVTQVREIAGERTAA
jgi:hypothetical protein